MSDSNLQAPIPKLQSPIPRGSSHRRVARTISFWVLKVTVALLVPFFVLVGGAVHLYSTRGVPTWLALAAAALATVLILLAYAGWLSRKITGGFKIPRGVRRGLFALVAAYSIYSLVYISSLNVKDEAIRGYYRSLHPLLRLAVSTFVLVDSDLVVTDMKRAPEDYVEMGLPVSRSSMHYPQPDGYVHAIDLRTLGQGRARNVMLELYFRAMGFRTLRHVGTADHLHVSLALPGG